MLITNTKTLLKKLELTRSAICGLDTKNAGYKAFPVRVPERFVKLMQKGNPHDPLLLQILPTAAENKVCARYKRDPLNEVAYQPISGVIHKYYGRVLLLATDKCCINCRFCFRRYQREVLRDWDAAVAYIAADATLAEVILSGGDPLTLSNQRLRVIIMRLAAIKHVKYLRIHSRLPILLPQRINQQFLQILRDSRLQVIIVVHCNHPNELDAMAMRALRKLVQAGITVLNQTVLLRSVNDDAVILAMLYKKLFQAHVLPYYLHLLDRVSGAQHFYISAVAAKKILCELMRQLPGYLVPKLVCDVPDAQNKTPIL